MTLDKQPMASSSKNSAHDKPKRAGKNKPWKKKIPKVRDQTPSNLIEFDYRPPAEMPQTVYSDDQLVVFSKPSGLLSVPGTRLGRQDSLVSRAQTLFPTARIVHRLDMDTSGLIVMALNADAHRNLSMQFEARNIGKLYHALVAGHPKDDHGVVELPLFVDWPNRPKQMVDFENGKPAKTEYEIVERVESGKGFKSARIALHPITGRSHQLRVHMLEIGHPILGDVFYAKDDALAASPRLCLHASELSFDHPVTNERMNFEKQPDF